MDPVKLGTVIQEIGKLVWVNSLIYPSLDIGGIVR